MKENTKKKLLLAAKILGVLFVVMIIAFFIFRESLLQTAISKVSDKMRRDYQSEFTIKEAHFDGLSGVSMREIALVPQNGDTLFRVSSMKTSINFWRLFIGDIQLGTLFIEDGFIHLIKNKNGSNYEAFVRQQQKSEVEESNEKGNIARRAYRILNTALDLIPIDMHVENVSLMLDNNGRKITLALRQLELVDKKLESSISVSTGSFSQNWKISGFADPRNNQTDLRFFNSDSGQILLPYIDERYNLKTAFDSIRLNVANIEMDGGELHIDGFTSVVNLTVNHPKIASKDVIINNARFDYRFLFGSDFMAIDSTSSAKLDRITVKPYIAYNVEEDTIYTLKMDIPKMKAQNFIESLPQGLFTNFEGMVAQGEFDYHLNIVYNKNKPRALVFNSKLNQNNLKIIKYGAANLSKINSSFTYRAIENGRPQRAILVSPENINYTPLASISPFLKNAVLTNEDPSFYRHRGFISDAFKQSIIQNLKTKKFTRGASTISMQLVKNVFLTRVKTLSRKLEEILLVYLLENTGITSKSRMLEVYFNVIEWGPNVYGVGEAAMFYFQKHPAELTLNESLFLAGIVPRPKAFMWNFTAEGELKGYVARRNNYIGNLMRRRGLIDAADTIYKSLPVILRGRARSFVVKTPVDSLQVDSLYIDDLEEFDF
ncbi:MAG TPA: transglycosylase domain-containing protein [Flavobacterium sp.]|nr:transglycosylase domain-containing protein [Flavobacterium sp.]